MAMAISKINFKNQWQKSISKINFNDKIQWQYQSKNKYS